MTVTAHYKTQYYLTVNAGGHGDVTGQNWFDAGTTATFSISPTTISGPTWSQYVFAGWEGTGSGSYNGTATAHSVTMNRPITETARWKTQYQVTISSSGGGSATPNGTDWYDAGSLFITATATQGYAFTSWTATGSITFANSSSASTTANITGSGTIRANFKRTVQPLLATVVQTSVSTNFKPEETKIVAAFADSSVNPNANRQADFTRTYQSYVETEIDTFTVKNFTLTVEEENADSNVINGGTIEG
jgi:hypothetical protein